MLRALALVATLALLAGCGGGPPAEQASDGLVTTTAGDGPGQVTVIRPQEASGPLPLVLFLHGWGATEPRTYRPWLEHLARAGNAVVYPRYQDSFAEPPAQVLGNALIGVRAALELLPDADRESLVVAGHSAGGALAADYAAIAASVGLPPARGVFSVYPGRRFRGGRVGIPPVDPARIPRDTIVRVLSGARDRVVDPRDARAIATGAGATERRLEVIGAAGASDHLGPQRDTAVAREEFWARLDALIAAAREN